MTNRGKDLHYRQLEEENEAKVDELHSKVSELKDISLKINGYLQEEKPKMQNLDDTYSFAGNLVSASMSKIDNLLNNKVGRTSCWLILVVFAFFMLIYLLR